MLYFLALYANEFKKVLKKVAFKNFEINFEFFEHVNI